MNPTSDIDVAANLARIRARIEAACAAAGRDPETVRLVAVSKRIPDDRVEAALRAGQRDLGENRIQDALDRLDRLPARLAEAGLDPAAVVWHFIGNLQRNKVRKAVGVFALLHAVDSASLADKISEVAVEAGVVQPILLEVNASGEEAKHGFDPARIPEEGARIAALPGLELRGLMTMARWGAGPDELRATFAALRRLAADLRAATGLPLPELSMGMSDDFEIAVAEGATLVRVGTAIFGPRD